MPSLFSSRARAGGAPSFPTRVIFFVTPHGTVWRNWKMDRPDLPTDRFVSAPLTGEADLGSILVKRPHRVAPGRLRNFGLDASRWLPQTHE